MATTETIATEMEEGIATTRTTITAEIAVIGEEEQQQVAGAETNA